jgi:uncharacterized protein YbjT (DUF2867 family)
MNRKVLITGATGATGSNAINRLLELGIPVRAMVHKIDDRSAALETRGVEIIKGDITSLVDISHALEGIDAAYYIYPLGAEGLVESTAFFAQAAIEQDVSHIVNMSQISARRDSKSLTAQRHWIAERIFDRSGIPVTHLRPTFFAETTLNYVMEVKKNSRLALPFADSKYAPIAAEDQGNVIAAILAAPSEHAGETYPLYGPVELTQYDTAEILSDVLGRKITYVPMEIAEFGEYLKGKRTDLQIQHLMAVAQDCREGLFSGTSDTVETITGQKPVNMRDFISEHKASFQ